MKNVKIEITRGEAQIYSTAQWEWIFNMYKEGVPEEYLADFLGIEKNIITYMRKINNIKREKRPYVLASQVEDLACYEEEFNGLADKNAVIDLQNVVRCKDCKYRTDDGINPKSMVCSKFSTSGHDFVVTPSWYCKDGKRK